MDRSTGAQPPGLRGTSLRRCFRTCIRNSYIPQVHHWQRRHCPTYLQQGQTGSHQKGYIAAFGITGGADSHPTTALLLPGYRVRHFQGHPLEWFNNRPRLGPRWPEELENICMQPRHADIGIHGTISVAPLPRIRKPSRYPLPCPSRARPDHLYHMVERPRMDSWRPRQLALRHSRLPRFHPRRADHATPSSKS